MSRYEGRHGTGARQSGARLFGFVAAVLLLITTAGAAWVIRTANDEPAEAGGPPEPPRTNSSGEPCPASVRVAVEPAYLASWTTVAGAYRVDGCAPVQIEASSSDVPTTGDDGPAGWLAGSRQQVEAAEGELSPVGEPTTVAGVPLVLALDPETVDGLGGPDTLARPAALGPLVRGVRSLPDGAELAIALPDPGTSVTGRLGFLGLVTTATGEAFAVPSFITPTRKDLTTIRIEHRVVALTPDELAVLDVDADPAANAFLTSAPVLAASGSDLAPVPLRGPRPAVPLVTLDADATEPLAAFATFLTSPEGAAALAGAGFVPADELGPLDEISAKDAGQVGTAFGFMHQRISTMVAIDASGSMEETFPGTDTSRIELVRRAARDGMRVASPASRSGLIVFRSDDDDDVPVITRPVDLEPNGPQSGPSHRQAMLDALDELEVSGGTPLYNAVREAYDYTLEQYEPGMVNQLLVLSDGQNRDAAGSISLEDLLADLADASDPDRPVRIIAIGIGASADMEALTDIAEATGGRATWLQSYEGYADAVSEALFTG
ncbi:vWA domain-containing protein [Nocardioides sp. GXZ039]|uniref:vWA domain-containing protein n=1 Tax=Nocardioides sp. GXZ039 TaxID=3136018 RepID=UPI0030F3E6F7